MSGAGNEPAGPVDASAAPVGEPSTPPPAGPVGELSTPVGEPAGPHPATSVSTPVQQVPAEEGSAR